LAKKARVYDGTAWQELASAQTDLTAYSTTAQINSLLSGSVKKVVSTAKTDTFTTTSTSYTDVTGLTVTITPSSATSKILIMSTLNITCTGSDRFFSMQLARGGSAIFVGDAAGSRSRAFAGSWNYDPSYTVNRGMDNYTPIFLDSPNTTSATTYSFQVKSENADSTVCINRSGPDADASKWSRGSSSITVMEILA